MGVQYDGCVVLTVTARYLGTPSILRRSGPFTFRQLRVSRAVGDNLGPHGQRSRPKPPGSLTLPLVRGCCLLEWMYLPGVPAGGKNTIRLNNNNNATTRATWKAWGPIFHSQLEPELLLSVIPAALLLLLLLPPPLSYCRPSSDF